MTWGEFKAAVEAAGVQDGTTLFCIDVEGWYTDPLAVEFGKDGTAWVKHKSDGTGVK